MSSTHNTLHAQYLRFSIFFKDNFFELAIYILCGSNFISYYIFQVREEVTSVFSQVFSINAEQLLDYDYLCVMTGMKKLKRPSVSSSFSWNGQEVASLTGQGSLYIMANTPLPSAISVIVSFIIFYYFSIKINSENDGMNFAKIAIYICTVQLS